MVQQRDAGARVVSKDTDMGEGPHFHAASKQKRNLVGVRFRRCRLRTTVLRVLCESETTAAPRDSNCDHDAVIS